MKRMTKDQIIDRMVKELEDCVTEFEDKIDKYELRAFLTKDNGINGKLVDKDENITPESVAALGAYTTVLSVLNAVKEIKDGKEPTYGETTTTMEMQIIAHDEKTGKTTKISKDELPPEVKDMLRSMLDGDDK